jgi:tight adherence protein B
MNDIPALALLAAAAVFGLICSVWMIGLVLWQQKKRTRSEAIETRLGLRSAAVRSSRGHAIHLWRDQEIVSTEVPGSPRSPWFKNIRHAYGPDTPPSTLILVPLGVMALSAMIGLLITKSLFLAAGFAAASLFPLWIITQHLAAKKKQVFEQQLGDALGLATQSLKAGHPLLGSFRVIAEEMEPPVGASFAEILQLQSMGVSLEVAVSRVAAESPSNDMKLFGASIVIQTRSGGNLADMIDRLADVIRDRMRLYRRARVLTAQTQLSKRILLAIPFFIFGTLHVLNADYIAPLYTTPAGRIMSVVSIILLIIGTWTINRIAVPKY